MTVWRSFMLWLASLSADPVEVVAEQARCEAAVMAAYAAHAISDAPPAPVPPGPSPAPPKKCACNGTKVIKPDGTIPQPCFCGENCACKPGGK